MLSRVADSLYWMSRYMERSDSILRMLRINYAYSQDDIPEFTWQAALKIFSFQKDEEISKIERNGREVLHYMVLEKENPNAVFNLITQSRENARSVQDHITKELWQCLNEFYHLMREQRLAASLKTEDPMSVLDGLIKQGMLYYGTVEITMARSEGFYYMNVGKYLERAMQAVNILDVKFSEQDYNLDGTHDPIYWRYLLLSISGYELFLRSYRSTLEPRNIIDQIIWNENFPRSILYAVIRLQRAFEKLDMDPQLESFQKLTFLIGKLKSHVQFSDMQTLETEGLHNYLQNLKNELFHIGTAFNHYYFAYD
ncbi:alpha-E domain-containing protein [Mucilaginibacter arboris]|uniref:Alpha-E domain-containing protein n=1 Tax=Mucilaginibacter arboris TaxID=2682090 RepID=A0A7K1T0X0_9SPHI|nr:alpha-E domain-containing protein [Mucilaginibacter arboris]MVN22930.1 alpha-E domain-containing protein [Mucilaginibacter arboris]